MITDIVQGFAIVVIAIANILTTVTVMRHIRHHGGDQR